MSSSFSLFHSFRNTAHDLTYHKNIAEEHTFDVLQSLSAHAPTSAEKSQTNAVFCNSKSQEVRHFSLMYICFFGVFVWSFFIFLQSLQPDPILELARVIGFGGGTVSKVSHVPSHTCFFFSFLVFVL